MTAAMATVPVAIGIVLALVVAAFASVMRLDADDAFYPTVLIVIALLYVLFAAIDGRAVVVLAESLIAVVFIAAASVGFRRNLWLVAAGLAAHGVLDLFHPGLIDNAGVPSWWPAFCSAYDVAAAGTLGLVVWRRGTARVVTPATER